MQNNPYQFTVKGVTFDFYDLSDAIQFEQAAVEHAVKKLVALGKRSGNKSYDLDLHEAIMSLLRAQEQQYDGALRRSAGSTREKDAGFKTEFDLSISPWSKSKDLHQRPTGIGAGAFAPPSPASSSRITSDPNDIEQAVQFIWNLGYSDKDNGPL